MSLNADTILERLHLINQARRWRIFALVVLAVSLFIVFEKFSPLDSSGLSSNHIARFQLSEMIVDDKEREALLEEIAEDDDIKALILEINSPGGTTVASEQLYLDLREIAAKKPVIASLQSMATSGAYMAAIAADHIVARRGTITGSVGVIMQAAEFTNLAENLGITPIIVRSGTLKAVPNPLEKMSEPTETMLKGLIDSFFDYFISLVAERRNLTAEQRTVIADGRVVSATQAITLNLVDEIGGEKQALAWLQKTHNLSAELDIRDYEVPEEENPFEQLLKSAFGESISSRMGFPALDGLMAIWHPSMAH